MKRPEQEFQRLAVDWLTLAIHHDRTFFWATPNETGQGGKRGAVLGKIRKGMGVVAGIPDLLLLDRDAGLIGLELKAGKNTQTAAQKTAQGRLEAAGAAYYVCRSIDDIHNALEAHSVPLRARRPMI